MKKLCSCYETLESGNKRIVVRTHSFIHKGEFFPIVYCIECGAQSFIDKNVLVIDAEELNVPLNAIVEEFSIVKKQLKTHNITPTNMQLFNIMLAIVWNYGVDYYQEFDNYIFKDVRNTVIDYFINNKPELSHSFLEYEQEYSAYLKYVKNTLITNQCKTFNLEEALNDPNIFTSTNHTLYGPASLVYYMYTDTQGMRRKSNNAYYSTDKYFREHRSDLLDNAERIYLAIKHSFCMYLKNKCEDFPQNLFYEVDTIQDLKQYVLIHTNSRNKLIITGFLKLFKDIIDNADIYLNITSRTYVEYLQKLENAEKFVNEHLR